MARKLKVYRTAIGFHDAYVAAASQKAALEAWGSDANLFGLGMAELVTDETLSKAPLETPGKVVKVTRGSAEDHYAALPKDAPAKPRGRPTSRNLRTTSDGDEHDNARARRVGKKRSNDAKAHGDRETDKSPVPASLPKARKPAKPKPRPSREKLDTAERALEKAIVDNRAAVEVIRARARELERERRALEARNANAETRLEAAVAKAETAYELALDTWRKSELSE